jgi:cytochrome c oxidase subunit II
MLGLVETPRGLFSMGRLKKIFLIVSISFVALTLWAAPKSANGPKTIEITESRFNFQPDEITVTKGQEVTLVLHSTDVTHGLVVETLGIKETEIKKGRPTSVTFTPDTVGTFEGKCAHFCGPEHGSMHMVIHVVEPSGASQ